MKSLFTRLMCAFAVLCLIATPAFAEVDSVARGLAATAAARNAPEQLLRLARIAAAAHYNNPLELPVYGQGPTYGITPPTVAVNSAHDAALTRGWQTYTGGTNTALTTYGMTNGKYMALYGGLPLVQTNNPSPLGVYTTSTNSSVVLASRPTGLLSSFTPNDQGSRTDLNGFGGVYEFMTDSASVEIWFNDFSGPAYRIQIDGQYIQKTPAVFATNAGARYLELTSMPAGAHRVSIEMKASGVFGINVLPTASIWAPDTGDVVRALWLTDSYGAGGGLNTGTELYAQSMFDECGVRLGWRDNRHISIGGTGMTAKGPSSLYANYQERIADIAAHAPADVIGIHTSVNENNSSFAAANQAATTAIISTLRRYFPKALIIFTGMPGTDTGPSASVLAVENAVKAGMAAANDPLTMFVPVSTDDTPWFFGNGNVGSPNGSGPSDVYTASDHLHPANSAAHAYMGQRCAATVRTQLKTLMKE